MILSVAFILDLLLGDPHNLPHPICFIGNMIKYLEGLLRPQIRSELLGGTILWFLVVSVCFALPWGILWLLSTINIYLALAVEIFWCWQILAVKSLKDESMRVYKALVAGDLMQARLFLSYIVGRDTHSLQESAIAKATVETIAENTTDGVLAPMLFIAVGGAPLGFAYKAINTMDSMLGYKNEKYLYFGRCAAYADDVANFIPARVTALLMMVAAALLRLNAANAWKIFWRDRYNHKSPNSAQTEAVCAGALGIQLGGTSCYFGQPVEKPTIGDELRSIAIHDIVITNRLMYATAALGVLSIEVPRLSYLLG